MADISKALGTDLAALAQILRSKGRGKDSVLAHITPKEAALLKKRGGRGSINPDTGLPEYDDGEGDYAPAPVEQAPVEQYSAPVTDYSQAYTPEVPVSQDQQIQPVPQTGGFDPLTYGTAPGEQVYRGEAGVPTPAYASGTTGGSTAFGATGGALVDTSKPGAATLLEPGGAGTTTTPTDTGETGGAGKASGLSDILKGLGITGSTAARLGIGAGLGAYGASQARKTAGQIAAATAEQKALGQPYQTQGQQLVSQAQQGVLTPASQQAYNAAKAQLAQAQANRGGVGSQQAANQLADTYQKLLDNQYNYGLKVMNIGDNIAMGAIKTGMQLDAQFNQATTNFYSQLANYIAGGNIGQPQQPVRVNE